MCIFQIRIGHIFLSHSVDIWFLATAKAVYRPVIASRQARQVVLGLPRGHGLKSARGVYSVVEGKTVHDQLVWKQISADSTWHIIFGKDGYWQFTDNIDTQVGSMRSSQQFAATPADTESWLVRSGTGWKLDEKVLPAAFSESALRRTQPAT